MRSSWRTALYNWVMSETGASAGLSETENRPPYLLERAAFARVFLVGITGN